jgi:rhodanese-related sulfurtransferase
MKWKQFLTPVASIDGEGSRELEAAASAGEILYLDVRQPGEYEKGHLPGAKLIPLPDLDRRLDELDPERPTVIY